MTTDTEIARSTLASLSYLFTDLRADARQLRRRQLNIMEEMVTNCVLHLCSANDSYQRSIGNYDILINAREETNMLQEDKLKIQEEKLKLQEEKLKLQEEKIKDQEEKIKDQEESKDIFKLIAKDALRNQLELRVENTTLSDRNTVSYETFLKYRDTTAVMRKQMQDVFDALMKKLPPLDSIMEAYKDPTPVIVHMHSGSLGTRRKCTIKSRCPGYYTE